jgi:hypothetical protein
VTVVATVAACSQRLSGTGLELHALGFQVNTDLDSIAQTCLKWSLRLRSSRIGSDLGLGTSRGAGESLASFWWLRIIAELPLPSVNHGIGS